MSRYKAYPEYKNSGVDNLGVIPCAWEVMQLKRSVLDCVNGIWGSEPENDGNDTVVIRVADFDRPRLSIVDDGFTYRKIDPKEKRSRLLKRGDLLLEKSGGGEKTLVGQVVLFDKDFAAVTSNFVAKMTPHPSFSGSYLNYVFSRFYSSNINYCSIKQNTGIQNLDSASYLSEKFGFPPLPEQEKIASFLDHETAKIDALIEKQQRLIELLKEKRQAVISHAVTKGLNPNAPTKDSGVEWLGELPAHWQIKSLRYLGNCQNGINIGAEYFGSGYPFVSYGDVYRNDTLPIQVEGLVQSTHTDREIYSVRTGDILFTRTSETVDEIGFSAACLKTLENATFAGFLIRFRPNTGEVAVNFAKHYFRSTLMRSYFVQEMNLVTRASLSQDLLKRLPVPLPPENEQLEIAEYLDAKSRVFSKLTSNAETAIQLLKERRTALISAAVTGKIDVRDWQAAA
jgi:type I restriction enzyme S subunit